MRVRYMSCAAALTAVAAATALGTAGALAAPTGQAAPSGGAPIRHVLLISVDGLHQQDIAWYTQHFRTQHSRRSCPTGSSSTMR